MSVSDESHHHHIDVWGYEGEVECPYCGAGAGIEDVEEGVWTCGEYGRGCGRRIRLYARGVGEATEEPESLSQLHEAPWEYVRGAEIVVEKRESGEERRGEIVGRHVGERVYYDSRRGENVVDYDSEMVVIDTERDTTLEVPTDAYDLVEFDAGGENS